MENNIRIPASNDNKRRVFRNNFGAIRYILAVAIFISHFNIATGSDLKFPISGYFRVCAFFVMSGFLIYGSYYRSGDWKKYLSNRAWRILPSYLITVVGCAVLLVFVSDYSWREYFLSGHWFRYLAANALTLNFIEPSLPGVFTDHPMDAVNASLWTMKVEWVLYFVVIPVVWWTRRSHWSFWKVFTVIFIFSVIYKFGFQQLSERTGKEVYQILGRQFGGQLVFFYSGVLLYVYIDTVKKHLWWLAAVCVPIMIIGTVWFPTAPLFYYVLFPLGLAGSVVALAFIGRWGAWAEMFENCSYEIYLFHFPMVQVSHHFGLTDRIGELPAFLCVFTVTTAMAYVVARYISAPLRRSHRMAAKKRKDSNIPARLNMGNEAV